MVSYCGWRSSSTCSRSCIESVVINTNFCSSSDHLLGSNNPVLTCIGLGTRTEKKPCKPSQSPQQQQQEAKDIYGDSDEEGVWSPKLGNYLWSPFECPQPWSPFYHTCHQPRHELWARGTFSLPQTMAWDRFESLIQELDSKQSDLSPPQTSCSITNLQLSDKNVRHTFDIITRFAAANKPILTVELSVWVLPQHFAFSMFHLGIVGNTVSNSNLWLDGQLAQPLQMLKLHLKGGLTCSGLTWLIQMLHKLSWTVISLAWLHATITHRHPHLKVNSCTCNTKM